MRKVVQTAEQLGFSSLLIPTRFVNGLFDESAPLAETWTMATALAAVTSRIRFLIAIRPGFIAAGLLAQMMATLDQISQGRVDLTLYRVAFRAISSGWGSRSTTLGAMRRPRS